MRCKTAELYENDNVNEDEGGNENDNGNEDENVVKTKI